jgi:5'-nucleotidase
VDRDAEAAILEPLAEGLAALDRQQAGRTDVALEGRREALRRGETNLGDLVADAVLWAGRAEALAGDFEAPQVALVPTSAIRVDARIAPRVIAQRDLYEWMGPGGYLAVAEVDRAALKLAFEHAVSRVEDENGRFLQIAGVNLGWAPQAMGLIRDPNGEIIAPGARVRSLALADGTEVVSSGSLVGGAPIRVVAPAAMLLGGDGFELGAEPRFIPASLGESLRGYVTGAIEGRITATQYPEGGEGRIVEE